jgi:flagellar L-ring protein precursor FlgH
MRTRASSWPSVTLGQCRRRRLRGALIALMLQASAMSGCASRVAEIGREPVLSPVGSGIANRGTERLPEAENLRSPARRSSAISPNSLWLDRGADLFKDPRARRPGDILTVTISMKDRASFDNSSKRSRDSAHGFGLSLDWQGFATEISANADSKLKSSTSTDGKGAIARSENIDLRIAAVVTGVLPNGNLLIEGSQELRVNYELRVLTFTGVVNVADIKADNTISHERIAEARMSYGGRGRSMEVQQPAWGHQIIDLLFPF